MDNVQKKPQDWVIRIGSIVFLFAMLLDLVGGLGPIQGFSGLFDIPHIVALFALTTMRRWGLYVYLGFTVLLSAFVLYITLPVFSSLNPVFYTWLVQLAFAIYCLIQRKKFY